KSDGNSITPVELFTGDSPHVHKGYSPMVVRYFFLLSHYRSTNDLTDEALLAAEKGFKRLMEAKKVLDNLVLNTPSPAPLDQELTTLMENAFSDMDDDFNTPKALSRLFDMVSVINSIQDQKIGKDQVSAQTWSFLREKWNIFLIDILGLQDENTDNQSGTVEGLMNLVIDLRHKARTNKDWGTSDQIRDALQDLNIVIKDGKDETSWTYK